MATLTLTKVPVSSHLTLTKTPAATVPSTVADDYSYAELLAIALTGKLPVRN